MEKTLLRIYDNGGLYKTVVVDKSTQADSICDKINKKLFLDKSSTVKLRLSVKYPDGSMYTPPYSLYILPFIYFIVYAQHTPPPSA